VLPVGPLWCLTAVVDGNVSGRVLHRWVVAVVLLGGGVREVAECVSEEVDGLALESEAVVCVHGGGDADVGVAQQFLDDDEFDALLQEECRC
jgi:hypothetical protein